jgi:rsbT co-antagonist protein RsbR
MAQNAPQTLNDILQQDDAPLLEAWIEQQVNAAGFRPDRLGRPELTEQARRFLSLLRTAVSSGSDDIYGAAWTGVRQMLEELSSARAHQGFSPRETALFIFSLKGPLIARVLDRARGGHQLEAVLAVNRLLDALGLYTTEVYQRGRHQVMYRQQQEVLELSTPVVTLWDGVLALPVIGTLDSARTQVVMESLLQRIVESGASIAIIDITGVPTVDTLTAQHLLKTVAAARLMGADCIISGIRPQIAQTIVHLGVELGAVVTKATLADAFAVALRRRGLVVQTLAPATRPRLRADDPDAGSDRHDG